MELIKLHPEVVKFLDDYGTTVNDIDDGDQDMKTQTYYFMPYWLKHIKDDVYEMMRLDKLDNTRLKELLTKYREEPRITR